MEKVRTNQAGNNVKLVLIIIALLMLLSHLIKQVIDSNHTEKGLMIEELTYSDSSNSQHPIDTIWHNTEFVQN